MATVSKNIAPDSTESDQIPLFDIAYGLVDVPPGVTIDDAPNGPIRHSEFVGDRADGNTFSSSLLDETSTVLGESSSTSCSVVGGRRHVQWHWNMSPRRAGKHRVKRRSFDAEIARDVSDRATVCEHLTCFENNVVIENCSTLVDSSCVMLWKNDFCRNWFYVLPVIASQDLMHETIRASVLLSQLIDRELTTSIKNSHRFDLIFVEERETMRLAASRSSAEYHISHIVFVCADLEIVWIDVERNVQLMQNEHSRWNRPNENRVRNDMSSPLSTLSVETSVSSISYSSPQPWSAFRRRITRHLRSKDVCCSHQRFFSSHKRNISQIDREDVI